MISQDDLSDHFERQYAQGGPSANMARAVLDLFDRTVDAEAELEEWGALGDRTETIASLERLDVLEDLDGEGCGSTYEMLVRHGLVIGDEPLPFVEAAVSTSSDLRLLCVDAGLLARGDYETDPIPLIRMFLPIEGD